MKFGKITSPSVSNNALVIGASVAGGAISGGLMTLVPQKQELLARGSMVAVGMLGASTLKGATSTEKLVKFMLLGLALRQAGEIIKNVASPKIEVSDVSTKSQKFIAGMAGLACPCDGAPALASPFINFPALNYADANFAEQASFVESDENTALI